MNPRVTMIIPVWDDRDGKLLTCLNSAVSQLYDNYEVLVVMDGGGTQKAKDIVAKFTDVPILKVINIEGKNSGTAVIPRNIGIKYASGDYIAFLDSDDIAYPNRIATSLQFIGNCDLLYSDCVIDDNGTYRYQKCIQTEFNHMMKYGNAVNFNTVFMKTKVAREIGGLRPEMKYCEDYSFLLRLLYQGYRFVYHSWPLGVYRLHDKNLEKVFKPASAKWIQLARDKCTERLPPIIAGNFEQDALKNKK